MNGRFAVLNIWQIIQLSGYILEFTTDSPVHLWLGYTYVEPAKHLEPVLRRGLEMHCNPRFCFVAPHTEEQNQAGDTTFHSFEFDFTSRHDDIWFYLWGEIGGVRSNSTSPIMHLPHQRKWYVSQKSQAGYSNSGMAVSWNQPRAMVFEAGFLGGSDGFSLYCYGYNQPAQVTFSLMDTTALTNKPLNILEQVTLNHIPEKREWPLKGKFFIPFPHVKMRTGFQYAIAVEGDPTKPATDVFWWSRWPIDWPKWWERSWYGVRVGGAINWLVHGVNICQYHIYNRMPFYQPGEPTSDMIYPKTGD